VRTRVGYAGGTTRRPTYKAMGDHTETFEVDYDPRHISYEDLLALFWESHNPCGASFSRQYRSLILVHNEKQRRAAEASREKVAKTLGQEVTTPIEAHGGFTRAEDYHQKFTLRGWKAIAAELSAVYGESDRFTDSSAAMRLNAYLSGHGSPAQLEREIALLGLSTQAQRHVRERVRERHRE
jgi:peptide-methionine (S)-S-oxide reductase